jgi:eukaryotic-like serine/threonine-protein kinase
LVLRWPGHARERSAYDEGGILKGLLPGAIVGERYRIVEPLARGGFGTVYVAEQLTTERRVALKMLARYAEDVSVERLLSEARVTSRIASDHIVQVIDAGVDTTAGDVFVVMELLRGTTLDDRVMEHGPLSASEVVESMRQIAAGLDKAHRNVDMSGRPAPIIHRDLKPSNVFVTQRDDGRPLLKILDFGAAKVLSQTTKASGVVRGTPQFMACEQAMGEPSTIGTDIWALGLIAFYLLTGRSYWLTVENNGTEAQLFAEILNLPLPPASSRARQLGASLELPSAFDVWFSRCVNRDQTQRFGSASAAATELARALGVVMAPLPASASPAQKPAAEPSLRSASARQLETQELAVLSMPSRLAHASRARFGLAMLGLLLAGTAGAAAVILSKQALRRDATATSLSAAPAISATQAPAVATSAARLVAPPSSSAGSRAAPGLVPASSAPHSRSKSQTRRVEVPVRTTASAQPAGPARDPYEQR